MLTDCLPVNIVVAGVGGQGNVLVSQLLGKMMMGAGLQVTIGETYGASQRGGSVMSHVRLSGGAPLGPLMPEGAAHLVVGLEPLEAVRMLGTYGNPGVRVLTNDRTVEVVESTGRRADVPPVSRLLHDLARLSREAWVVPATDVALAMGDAILANMVLLGALHSLKLLPFRRADFQQALASTVSGSRGARNLEAFDAGGEALLPLRAAGRD